MTGTRQSSIVSRKEDVLLAGTGAGAESLAGEVRERSLVVLVTERSGEARQSIERLVRERANIALRSSATRVRRETDVQSRRCMANSRRGIHRSLLDRDSPSSKLVLVSSLTCEQRRRTSRPQALHDVVPRQRHCNLEIPSREAKLVPRLEESTEVAQPVRVRLPLLGELNLEVPALCLDLSRVVPFQI